MVLKRLVQQYSSSPGRKKETTQSAVRAVLGGRRKAAWGNLVGSVCWDQTRFGVCSGCKGLGLDKARVEKGRKLGEDAFVRRRVLVAGRGSFCSCA